MKIVITLLLLISINTAYASRENPNIFEKVIYTITDKVPTYSELKEMVNKFMEKQGKDGVPDRLKDEEVDIDEYFGDELGEAPEFRESKPHSLAMRWAIMRGKMTDNELNDFYDEVVFKVNNLRKYRKFFPGLKKAYDGMLDTLVNITERCRERDMTLREIMNDMDEPMDGLMLAP